MTTNAQSDTATGAATIDEALWSGLCRFVRTVGRASHEEAEDITQDLFCHLLAGGRFERLRDAAASRTHFVNMLKKAARRRLIDHHRNGQRKCRRGWTHRVPLDEESAHRVATTADPDAYGKLEAIAAAGESELGAEFARRGKADFFDHIRAALVPDTASSVDYAALARRAGRSEPALRVAICRARQRYRKIVRERIQLAA